MGSSKYSLELRREAVRLVIEYARPVADVAVEVGVPRGTLHRWLNQARNEQTIVAEQNQETLAEEVVRLRKELAEKTRLLNMKEQENEFLKKAASFFAAETSPVNRNRLTGTR